MKTKKRLLSILLSLALVLGLLPGMSLTAYAGTTLPAVDYQTFFVNGISGGTNMDVVEGTGAVDVTGNTTGRGVTWDATEKCAVFDGEAYLVISNPLSNANASTGFTITMEAYISSANKRSGNYINNLGQSVGKYGWQRLFDLSNGTVKKYLYINAGADSHLRFALATTGIPTENGDEQGVTPPRGTNYYDAWHTYSLVAQPGGNMYLYVDGTQITSLTANATVTSVLNQLSSFDKCYIGTSVFEMTNTNPNARSDGFFTGKIRGFTTVNRSNVYTLSYNTNGAGSYNSVSTPIIPDNLPTPTKNNYIFAGWYTDSNLTKPATSGTELTANTTLYAKWATPYTVTYKIVNGTWSDNSTADKKETVASGSNPANVPTGMKANQGYTSGAWNTNPTTATITGATTFTYTFKQPSSVTKAPTAKNLTYSGSAQGLVTAGTASGGTMQYALGTTTGATESYTTSIPTKTNAGTYYVWYKVVGDANHFDTTPARVEATISRANINPTVNITGWTYNNTANQPTVSGNSGSGSVTYTYAAQGSDNYSAATPTNAGSYTVKATVATSTNYNGGEATANFAIAKANLTTSDYTYATPTDLTYNGESKTATVTLKNGVNGAGEATVGYYSDASCTVPATPTDAGTYYVGISVTQGSNYNAATLHGNSWLFTIAKADFSPTASYGSWTYGETAGTGSVSINPENGSVTWAYSTSQTGTYSAATPTNAGTYYAKATVGETANYNTATTAPVSFTISRADINPTVSMKNWTEGYRASEPEITGVMEDADVVFTYARRGSDEFTDKKPTAAGGYTVKATVAETANYNGAEATANFMIWEDKSSDLTVLSPLTTVTRVTMNGTVINSRYYTVSGGSVYFTEGFLESLKPGVYTIKVTDGNTVATTTYRVSGGETGSVVLSATTADHGVALYAALALTSTLGLAWMSRKRKAA